MGNSGALSCLNEPCDEQKHKPQLFPAGLDEPLFDRRNVFFFAGHGGSSFLNFGGDGMSLKGSRESSAAMYAIREMINEGLVDESQSDALYALAHSMIGDKHPALRANHPDAFPDCYSVIERESLQTVDPAVIDRLRHAVFDPDNKTLFTDHLPKQTPVSPIRSILAVPVSLAVLLIVNYLALVVIGFLGSIPLLGPILFFPSSAPWAAVVIPSTTCVMAAFAVSEIICKKSRPTMISAIILFAFLLGSSIVINGFVLRLFLAYAVSIGTCIMAIASTD